MTVFKEILRFFENFLKFYRNIRENLGKNLENMDLYGVRGGGRSPPKLAKLFKKLVEKSLENCKILKPFMKCMRILTLKS